MKTSLRSCLVLLAACGLAACNFPLTQSPVTAPPTPEASPTPEAGSSPVVEGTETPASTPTAADPTPSPLPQLEVTRIHIRSGEGGAEFFNPDSGETFVPRGVNYIHFLPVGDGQYRDCVMSTAHYDRGRVREAFRHLAEFGYNTVRIFFDTCSDGPDGLTNWNGSGLNPGYLDNMADLMQIAGEEGIYIIFTANAIPDGGGYWSYFDSIFNREGHEGFEDARNADWLHTAGVETKRKIWTDLLQGLAARSAQFETVLGWQLTNEYWLWGDAAPPFTRDEGLVTTANGNTYDMADPAQKHQMAVDGVLFFMEEIVSEIKTHDPQALTTMGFYAPHFSPDRYIVTGDIIDRAPVDFWDFHAYVGDISVQEQAESFGMVGYRDKPIIMGETASGYENVPSAATALELGVRWMVESCDAGFGGWLYWGYYPWPEEVGGKAWAMQEDGERIFRGLSPRFNPDPCTIPELEVRNLAYGSTARASNFLPGQPPASAGDGRNLAWTAGGFPPQWVEFELEEAASISRVGMVVDQWPPSITRHQVTAVLEDGSSVFLGQFDGFTTSLALLGIDLPAPLPGVRRVRITTLESRSWVSWREVEVLSAPAGAAEAPVCLGRAGSGVPVFADPLAEAEQVASLSGGQLAYFDGRHTDADGAAWLRSGGGTWIREESLALDAGCETLADVTPERPLVPVTFRVGVPDGTPGEVFLAGTFGGIEFEAWIPWMIVLEAAGGGTWSVDMLLPEGSEIQYVFTRGSWETIQRPESCGQTDPIVFTVSGREPIVREDQVVKWRDLDCE